MNSQKHAYCLELAELKLVVRPFNHLSCLNHYCQHYGEEAYQLFNFLANLSAAQAVVVLLDQNFYHQKELAQLLKFLPNLEQFCAVIMATRHDQVILVITGVKKQSTVKRLKETIFVKDFRPKLPEVAVLDLKSIVTNFS